jgi:hypothetical protein
VGTRLAARARRHGAAILCAALLVLGATRAPQPTALDDGLAAFWAASSDKDATRAIDQIVRSGASFDDVYARLAAGRRPVPRGSSLAIDLRCLPSPSWSRDYEPHPASRPRLSGA